MGSRAIAIAVTWGLLFARGFAFGNPEGATFRVLEAGEVGFEDKFSYSLLSGFAYGSDPVDLAATLSVHSDRKYGPEISNWNGSLKHSIDNWFRLEEGFTRIHGLGAEFSMGRMHQWDAFASPYSLFLSAAGNPALSMIFRFEKGQFRYESRWIGLNDRSRLGDPSQTPEAWRNATVDASGRPIGVSFPDRGANLRTLSWSLGTFRLGFQDATVYTERAFDLEHFVSPMPAYLTQYVKGTGGRPWSNGSNENNIMGGFAEWNPPEMHFGVQVLLDDFSTYFLTPDQSPNNPWKAAWTLGGELRTPEGSFGLHHAGALKYTFEPITSTLTQEAQSAYGYTYYPDVEYFDAYKFRPILLQDNNLGYVHGENNLAVMLTYATPRHWNFHWSGSFEFVLAGNNSPANPWHEALRSPDQGSQWLDDPVLQQSYVLSSDLRRVFGDWEWRWTTQVGARIHAFRLVSPQGPVSASLVDRYVKIFQPSAETDFVFSTFLGVTWRGEFAVPD